MAAHVDQPRLAVVVDHVGLAPAQMVDDAVNALLVSGNDARAQQNRVAALEARVLVVVDSHTRERRHRLALRAADENHNFSGA